MSYFLLFPTTNHSKEVKREKSLSTQSSTT